MEHESPFVTIFESPRATIRRIVSTDPTQSVSAILFAGGIVGCMESISSGPPSTDWTPVAFAGVAVGAGLVSLIFGRVWAAYQRWVGGLLGGVASSAEVLAAYAWGSLPSCVVAAVAVLTRFVVFGSEVLHAEQPSVAATSLLPTTLWLATTVGFLWSGVVALACYAEVNRFTMLRATGAALLGSAIVFAVLVLPLGFVLFVVWSGASGG